jgi:hypothetical protein
MFPLPKAAADAERYAFPLARAKTTRLAVQYPLARERKMATKSSAAADEAQIRQRVESWTTALRAKDLEGLMSHYAQDILVFDLAPPLQYKGAVAYRKNWADWFPLTCPGF